VKGWDFTAFSRLPGYGQDVRFARQFYCVSFIKLDEKLFINDF